MFAIPSVAPGVASPIKSFQKGTVIPGVSDATFDIVIANVNPARAQVTYLVSTDSTGPDRMSYSVEFLSSSTIRFTRSNTSTATNIINWQVLEYA